MTNKRLATYRLQINKDFTLFDAANILPYLADLNISDIYLSPVFESTMGSMHGYDISDFTKISDERGGEKAFAALNEAVSQSDHAFQLLLDIVPNHMGIAGENPFWLDVLLKGRESEYWSLFDIRVTGAEKIHLPILDGDIEDLVESQKIKIVPHERYGRGLSVNGRFLPIREGGAGKTISEILAKQQYVLTAWTETFDKISYRRFFDITDLIGVRVEDVEVYKLSHTFLFDLLHRYPAIRGVRVDHIDGLADPSAYLRALRHDVDYVLVEKILAREETLPDTWDVQGTTGYEFIDYINRLFVDPRTFFTLQSYWITNIDPRWTDFKSCVLQSKNEALETLFSSELKRVVALSAGEGEEHLAEIFWREITKYLSVYRTYAGEEPLSEQDKYWIQVAADAAREAGGPEFEKAAQIFMPRLLDPLNDRDRQIVREWQQLSGPAMAKGLEDTAHYRYTPLAALNEVGCVPDIQEDGYAAYFQWMRKTARSYPDSLLATSTHDTKRAEDTRHRLYALADRPEDWFEFYEEAVRLNAEFKAGITLRPATEYFLYQAIVGIWPLNNEIDEEFTDRIKAYLKKSAKEARLDTSWLKPQQSFEKNLDEFIENILSSQAFLKLAGNFAHAFTAAGALTSLSVLTLKILSGGVPDIYQGTDDWDFSLVDPDNRRPVNFDARQKRLGVLDALQEKEGRAEVLTHLVQDWRHSGIKLWLTKELLTVRQEFCLGPLDISPLAVEGKDKDSVIAYTIKPQDRYEGLIVVCPRYAGRYIGEDKIMPLLDVQIPVGGERALFDLMALKPLQKNTVLDLEPLFKNFPIVVLKIST